MFSSTQQDTSCGFALGFLVSCLETAKICNNQPPCFNCRNLVTNVIKGGYTQELGVLHDVYLQV